MKAAILDLRRGCPNAEEPAPTVLIAAPVSVPTFDDKPVQESAGGHAAPGDDMVGIVREITGLIQVTGEDGRMKVVFAI